MLAAATLPLPQRAAQLTHREYEELAAHRDKLTQEGLRRALDEVEILALREARDLCQAYLDMVFGNKPAGPWQPPARKPSTIRRM